MPGLISSLPCAWIQSPCDNLRSCMGCRPTRPMHSAHLVFSDWREGDAGGSAACTAGNLRMQTHKARCNLLSSSHCQYTSCRPL